jgi:hypothetical protein
LPHIVLKNFGSIFFYLKDGQGNPKYPLISGVVKASLSLSHGNADVERTFSKSGRILTEDKTCMGLKMLNTRLVICNGMNAMSVGKKMKWKRVERRKKRNLPSRKKTSS